MPFQFHAYPTELTWHLAELDKHQTGMAEVPCSMFTGGNILSLIFLLSRASIANYVCDKPDHTLDKAALRPLKPNKLVCEIDSEREGDTLLPNLNFSDYKIAKTLAIKYDLSLSNKILLHVKSVFNVFLSLLQESFPQNTSIPILTFHIKIQLFN